MTSKVWLALAAVVIVAVGVVAFVAYGHGTPSGTAAQRLESWVSATNLGQDIGTLQDDGDDISKVVPKGTGAVHTVCSSMATSAQTFNDNLPAPDTEVTQLLARAYGLEYDAAEACYRAGATGKSLLAQSANDRRQARRLFTEVLARVRRVAGSTVSTTTTTEPTTSTSFL